MKSFSEIAYRKSLQKDERVPKSTKRESMAISETVSGLSQEFAIILWKAVNKNEGHNNVFCPFSAILTMAIMKLASSGKTEREIQNTIKFSSDDTILLDSHQSFLRSIQGNDGIEIVICVGIFPQLGTAIHKEMTNILTDRIHGVIKHVNYLQPLKAVMDINEWAEKVTKKKIIHAVSPEDVDAKTRLTTVSVISFKGLWKTKFETNVTQLRPFYTDLETSSAVQMMQVTVKCPYGEIRDLECRAIALPYKGDRFSMVVVLPDATEGLHDLLEQMGPHFFRGIISQLTTKNYIRIEMPKFKEASKCQLAPVFQSLGVQTLFTVHAELGGLFENTLQKSPVSKIIQKTMIEVNEEGSFVAAPSAAPLKMKTFPKPSADTGTPFVVDRPFLFFIYDDEHNLPLLIGTRYKV